MTKYLKRSYHRLDVYTILGYYTGFGRCDDDFVDRLSRHYSVLIFSIFILIVSSVQFVGKPISCFTPASFTGAHITYTDFVCWISDTYFISFDKDIPEVNDFEIRQDSYVIRYYQYVPFILMLQTFGFFLPGFFWRSGSSHLGISLQTYLDQLHMSHRSLLESPSYRRQLIRNVAIRLDQYFRTRPRTIIPKLTIFYLFIKLTYVINILIQLICLHYFMNFNFNIKDIAERFIIYSNTVRHTSLQFPTNVLCDFIVRFLGKNKHRHTVQCVLPINIFNEKIFIFSYLWLILLFMCTIYNLIVKWIIFFLFHRDIIDTRRRRVHRTLSKFTLEQKQNNEVIQICDCQPRPKNFSQHYLQCDGIVIIRLLDMNTDLLTMNDLMDDLWEFYNGDPF
ncbi:unnamed protein product [Rotaria sordida]|uniref:Innexin n=1 Tax=Rotaria sordida TaxID=392033 RepID=A0A815LL69_9BILA|nr:unnamed protein product [Rotaria sordida]CAF1627591.1 unnamed protein product [Rotaria sordida]CAF3483221.1 unnamed protein product [Rotaria sordida]